MRPQLDQNRQNLTASLRDLTLSFGGVNVLMDVSLDIFESELLALIGPNGAGKTSLLNCISGFYHPQLGEVIFEGQKISSLKPVQRFKLGISRTFQNIELFDHSFIIRTIKMVQTHMY